MKKQNFLQGALILMIASMIVKIFGAIFKIPLTNIVGVTSMAYFNTAYGFYVIFYMISTAGIPVALSKMISAAEARGNKKEISKIFTVSYVLFFSLGIIGSLTMIFFSKKYSSYVHLEGLHYSIIAISTTLFFMCITSAYRGYFQGLKNMTPTAVSQIIGAAGKLFIGLFVAYIAVLNNLPSHLVASFTLLGITTGSIGSTIYLAICKKRSDKSDSMSIKQMTSECPKAKDILKQLIWIAIPITLSATILSLTNTIDTTLMIRRLVHSGIIESEAKKIMGAYTSMAVPINNLSPNLIFPFAISVIPTITGMFTSDRHKEAKAVITSVLRISSIIAIPCSIGLCVFSKPIVNLLYRNKEIIQIDRASYLATEVSASMLSVLAASIFFVAMVSVTNAVLQAYGFEAKTIISTGLGITVKILLNYVLIGTNSIGLYGAPIATLCCYVVITVVNLFLISRYTSYRPPIVTMISKPLFAATVSTGLFSVIYALIKYYNEKLTAIICIVFTALLYFLLLFAVKGVKNEDIVMMPKGKKIEKVLIKLKLLN